MYTGGEDDPSFFVERNVEDGSVLDYEVEGDWILRSEIKVRKKAPQVVIDPDYEKNS